MVDRSLMMHASIAGLALALAYVTWSGDGGSDSGATRPPLLRGAYGELTRLVWTEVKEGGSSTEVVLERTDSGLTARVVKDQENSESSVIEFPATKLAEKLLTTWSEIRAERALGQLSSDNLGEFGLGKDDTDRLSLFFGDHEETFQVGSQAFGSSSNYVLDAAANAYLVKGTSFRPLRFGANSLLDRRALPVDNAEIERVELVAADKSRELVQRYPKDVSKAFFADAAEPDEKLEFASGWIRRALALRIQELSDAEPEGDPAVRLVVSGPNDDPEQLTIWPLDHSKAWAKSSRFPKTLKMNPGATRRLLQELENVFDSGDTEG